MTDSTFVVLFTPGPPAIGEPREQRVIAESAEAAAARIKARYPNWCMVHKVTKAPDA